MVTWKINPVYHGKRSTNVGYTIQSGSATVLQETYDSSVIVCDTFVGVQLLFTGKIYPVYHGKQCTHFGYTSQSGELICELLFTRKMYFVYHGKQSTVFGYTIQSGAVMTVVHK